MGGSIKLCSVHVHNVHVYEYKNVPVETVFTYMYTCVFFFDSRILRHDCIICISLSATCTNACTCDPSFNSCWDIAKKTELHNLIDLALWAWKKVS